MESVDPTDTAARQQREARQVLLQLARRYRAPSLRSARGACFSASLALAAEARRAGVEVALLRWQVLSDPEFADHWAVKFDNQLSMDLTSAQFSHDAPLLHDITHYPPNFRGPREYPAHLFLRAYEQNTGLGAARLRPGFMWRTCFILWRHDTARALRDGSPIGASTAAWRLVHMAAGLAVQHLRGAAVRRLALLRSRER